MMKDVIAELGTLPGMKTLDRWLAPVRTGSQPPSVRPIDRRRVPMVSIIIPAHNEEHYLLKTLDALAVQNYPRYEVIVVANGCTDKTASIARNRCDRLFIIPEKSLGRARNAGAEAAQGELLVFLDADTLLERNALKVIARAFTRRHSSGTLRGCPDSPSLKYRLLFGAKNLMHRSRLHKGSVGVILCWKHAFLEVGGFDEGLEVRENSELMKRLAPFGPYCFVNDTPATTSMRRYERAGAWKTSWLWIKLWVESWFTSLRDKHYETVR